MSRTLTIAAIQMDGNPAPTAERLQRAEHLVVQAAQSGAQLVVLPELFNIGYGYTDQNFQQTESITGPTPTWLKNTAATYQIHLAGSFLLLDGRAIYNALLLFAPDGRMWRYDKAYPWGWERGYFRGRKAITIAHTDLGDIGMLICWDTAHRGLWRQYAGKVDLMLISSCPPDATNPTFTFQSGEHITFDDFGWVGKLMKNTARLVFGDMVNQQTGWLGVPAVQTVGCGHIQTPLPNPLLSLFSYIPVAPKLIKYLPQGRDIQLACDFVPGCKIVDTTGHIQTELTQAQGETFTLADVTLPDLKSVPARPQPKSLLYPISYLTSDVMLPLLSIPVYCRGLRQRLKAN